MKELKNKRGLKINDKMRRTKCEKTRRGGEGIKKELFCPNYVLPQKANLPSLEITWIQHKSFEFEEFLSFRKLPKNITKKC